MTRPINKAGLDLIKSFEQFRASPYLDESGVATIAWGHTHGVTMDTSACTEEQGEQWLMQDLAKAESIICDLVRVSLSDNQYAALVSLTFNCGSAPLRMTLGNLLNNGFYDDAAKEFPHWRLSRGVISDGLIRRRKSEMSLFNTPDSKE